MPPNDLALLQDWRRKRDAAAFRELVRRHATMVFSTCRRVLQSRDDAEDVAQDCFVRLATDDTTEIRSSLAGWLHRLAIHRSKDFLRSEARRRARESAAAKPSGQSASTSEWHAVAPLVDAAIDRLPSELQEILVEHYLEQRPFTSIGRDLGLSRRVTAYRAQKAIDQVRSDLRARGVQVGVAAFASMMLNHAAEAVPKEVISELGKVAVAGVRASASGPSTAATTTVGAGLLWRKALAWGTLLAVAVAALIWYGTRPDPDPETLAPPDVPARTVRVVPAQPSAGPSSTPANEAPLPETTAKPTAVAEPETHRVVGTVVDSESEEPVAGARVEFGREDTILSDGTGHYMTERKPGKYHVTAVSEGYARAQGIVNVTEPGDTQLNFRLDRSVDVVARVVDVEGHPVPGVSVEASIQEKSGMFDTRDAVITDENGEAIFQRNGRHGHHKPQIMVRKKGYRVVKVGDIQTDAEGSLHVAIVVDSLARNERVIEGRITDANGTPLPGASVTWNDGSVSYGPEGPRRRNFAIADHEGNYQLRFQHLKWEFALLAHLPGYAPALVEGVRAGTETKPRVLDFRLPDGHFVEGQVVDGNGEPIAGVRVSVRTGHRNLTDLLKSVRHETKTEERGLFRIENLPALPVSLDCSKSGWSSVYPKRAADQHHKITMWRYGVVRGRVVEEETERPVSNFRVRIETGSGYGSTRRSVGETFTSKDGRFTMANLPRGPTASKFSFRIEVEGFSPAFLRDVAAEIEDAAEEHIVRVAKGRDVIGLVRDAATGRPMSGVDVHLGIPESRGVVWAPWALEMMQNHTVVQTREDGTFEAREGEALTVFLRHEGYRRVLLRPEDREAFIDHDNRLVIELVAAESLRGELVAFETGEPPRGVGLVSLRRAPRGNKTLRDIYGFHEFKESQRFRWNDLHPGHYQIFLDSRPSPKAKVGTRLYYGVELREKQHREVKIGEDLGTLTFSCQLIVPEGEPVRLFWLVLEPKFAWAWTRIDGFSNAGDGRISIQHLKPGTYRVAAERYVDNEPVRTELGSIQMRGDMERVLRVE